MIQQIKLAMGALSPAQLTIVIALQFASIIAAGLAIWGFTCWNRRAASV